MREGGKGRGPYPHHGIDGGTVIEFSELDIHLVIPRPWLEWWTLDLVEISGNLDGK